MAGQLIRRGERTWLVRILLGYDPKTGKRQILNKTIKGTKKDAQHYLNAALRDKDLGTLTATVRLTFDQFLNQWIATAAGPRVRERTLSDYVEKIDRYIRPALGGLQISNIRPLDIQMFYKSLTDQGLSPRTVRYVHAIVRSSLRHAVNLRVLPQNPAEVVQLPRILRKEMKALSREQAGRFLMAAKEDPCGIIFAVALTTGMRPEEYFALQWKDVDLLQGTATVQRTLVWRKGGGWYFGEPKTSHSRRTVPLPTSVFKWLQDHRRQQIEQRLKLGADYEHYDLIFATAEGKPLHYRNVTNRHFRPILRRAKLPETFRLYDLRHSCATLLLAANEHPKIVSERLGHASVTLTLDTYSHVLPSMQQAATEKLESMLFG